MGRIFNAVFLIAMIIGAGITYSMKHRAEMAADNLARLQAAIVHERDSINLLKAEWSMLTQPSRIQGIVGRYADHFDLAPFSASQVATMTEIPDKPIDAKPADMAHALAEADLTKLIRQRMQ